MGQADEAHGAAELAKAWWKEASVYQIYPSSFYDSNGDGVGDIPGITSKLDYIKNLGVDVVWVTPFFKSPQVDMGYDISDYTDIHPPYGTLADVEELIAQCHKRNLKFVADLVVNHTSDQHAWFQQSRSSKTNPYRNWYIWRPPRYDSEGKRCPPNNWRAAFGGSSWTFDELTQEYYLHCFAPQQPDLNWENPDTVGAVHKVMEFWLDKGVDGWRMDVINFCAKAPGFPDAPVTNPNEEWQDASAGFCANGPRLHEHLKGLGQVLERYGAFSVGEMPGARDKWEILKVVDPRSKELNMIFQFDIIEIDLGPGGKFSPRTWKLTDIKDVVNRWQTFMHDNGGWSSAWCENHDQARFLSRFATDEPPFRTYAAKLLATWLGCQCGTLYIFQGQELGMKNVPKEWSIEEEYKDIESRNAWDAAKIMYKNDPAALAITRRELQKKARDNARTPIQWTSAPNGGFTTGTPWMSVNPDYKICNAAAQTNDADSVLNYWRRVLKLRKKLPDVLVYGSFKLVDAHNETVFAYERKGKGMKALVVLNWGSEEVVWKAPGVEGLERFEVMLSNYEKEEVDLVDGGMELRPWEACVLVVSGIE